MLQKEFTMTHETETEATFTVGTYFPDGDYSEMNETYFKTREAAAKAAGERCNSWGSNLVSLGSVPVEVNGATFFENRFNVWD